VARSILLLLFFATLLIGCAIQPVSRIVTSSDAYGQSPDSELACRLLRASRCAYAIVDTNTFDHTDKSYSACADGAGDQRSITDHEQRLNAVMMEVTGDAVVIAFSYIAAYFMRFDGMPEAQYMEMMARTLWCSPILAPT